MTLSLNLKHNLAQAIASALDTLQLEPAIELAIKEQQSKIDRLEKENVVIKRVLKKTIAKLHRFEANHIHSKALSKNGLSNSSSQKKPKHKSSTGIRSEERAEKWVRDNIDEWFDNPCQLERAAERSWRELACNEGDKILIKGHLQPPRAYLHVIESTNKSAWNRMKAKVALELGKTMSYNHYSHPIESECA